MLIINLKKIFIETFEEEMLKENFQRKKNIFHRIINGKIVQLLSYTAFSGSEFTIQFLIEPLCTGEEYSAIMDEYRICETFENVERWESFRNHKEANLAMKKALEVTQEHVIPLFNIVVDYQSFMKEMDEKRKLLHPFSNAVYMGSMASGNYEISKKSRESLFENRIKTCQINWGTDYHRLPERQAVFEKDIIEYTEMKGAMDNYDFEKINNYISMCEKKSLESYIKTFTTPKKYLKYLETGEVPFEFVEIT